MENGFQATGRGVCFSNPETALAFQLCAPRLRCVPGYVSSRFPYWVRNTVIKTLRYGLPNLGRNTPSWFPRRGDTDSEFEKFLERIDWKELEAAL